MRCVHLVILVSGLIVLALTPHVRGNVSFEFTYVDDAQGTLASRGWLNPDSLFQRNIRAAADSFGQLIDADTTFVLVVDTVSYAARAGGQFTFGRLLGTDGDGHQIWEHGPLTRILTGDNPGENFFGFDIRLGFDIPYLEANYWLDPEPETRTAAVAPDRGDFVSVAMHELGHGFGIAGNRDHQPGPNYGGFTGSTISVWDTLTYFGGNGAPTEADGDPNPMFFSGAAAAEEFGGDVPITHVPQNDPHAGGNFYHLGTCNDSPMLTGALMNGCTIPDGERLFITPLDRAILADLGYPLLPEALDGDYNGDGFVNAADYTVWRNHLNQPFKLTNENPSAMTPGEVDREDYDFWKASYIAAHGSGSTSAADLVLGAHVPEPSTWVFLVVTTILASRVLDRYDRFVKCPGRPLRHSAARATIGP
jgi:hypothetical protein